MGWGSWEPELRGPGLGCFQSSSPPPRPYTNLLALRLSLFVDLVTSSTLASGEDGRGNPPARVLQNVMILLF